MGRPLKLVHAVTHAVSADLLLRGQLEFLRRRGFDVTLISGGSAELLSEVASREGVRAVRVDMDRAIAVGRDARALAGMIRVLRGLRPDIVTGSTPKAGLLAMIAARLLDVPARVYLLRGLRLETETGTRRAILAATERIASGCAHEVVCVSKSLRDVAVEGRFVPSRKARVLGEGSSNGVDTMRFRPTDELLARGRALRKELGIPPEAPVIGFVGRPSRDKGIDELLAAMAMVRRRHPDAKLLIVGAEFARDEGDDDLAARLRDADAHVIGSVRDTALYYAAMDVLAFPSRREGFPNVPLEAAAMALPTVGFRATGVVDAVEDGVTGTLVPSMNVEELGTAICRYVADAALRRRHGDAARARVLAHFTNERVWKLWAEYYDVLYERCLRS